jgi:hypothetical protein
VALFKAQIGYFPGKVRKPQPKWLAFHPIIESCACRIEVESVIAISMSSVVSYLGYWPLISSSAGRSIDRWVLSMFFCFTIGCLGIWLEF